MRIDTGMDGRGDLVLDITSVMDLVFLLLIFFMLATTYRDPEREIDLDLPEATSSLPTEIELEEIVINVMRDGRVLLGQQGVDLDGLVGELRRAAEGDPDTAVTIRGDRLVAHEVIVSVMDACGKAGLANLSVGTLDGT